MGIINICFEKMTDYALKNRAKAIEALFILGVLYLLNIPGTKTIFEWLRKGVLVIISEEDLTGINQFFEWLYSEIIPVYLGIWLGILILVFVLGHFDIWERGIPWLQERWFRSKFTYTLARLLSFWWIIYKFSELLLNRSIKLPLVGANPVAFLVTLALVLVTLFDCINELLVDL